MLISEFVFFGWVFCFFVSVYSLVFWSVWPVVEKCSLPVLGAGLIAGVVSGRVESLCSSWGLGHGEAEWLRIGDKVLGALVASSEFCMFLELWPY